MYFRDFIVIETDLQLLNHFISMSQTLNSCIISFYTSRWCDGWLATFIWDSSKWLQSTHQINRKLEIFIWFYMTFIRNINELHTKFKWLYKLSYDAHRNFCCTKCEHTWSSFAIHMICNRKTRYFLVNNEKVTNNVFIPLKFKWTCSEICTNQKSCFFFFTFI